MIGADATDLGASARLEEVRHGDRREDRDDGDDDQQFDQREAGAPGWDSCVHHDHHIIN